MRICKNWFWRQRIFNGLATKEETKALHAAKLPQGRPGQSSNFDRIDDIKYNFRSRRLI